ncbi:MAG: extracellular solute-binding protein [Planctomycetota bacterium]|jgi:iron(III) transport system substrate-binding protein|nr:extracellular solute-binding protein [Planctomycetota bacterium]
MLRLALLLVATAASLMPLVAADSPLVVYCGRKEALVGPLLKQFSTSTGIPIDVRYNKTPAIAAQLLAEGAQTPADLFYAQDSGYLGALSGAELLATLPADLLAEVDPRFSDPNGRWLGVSGRLRVLVYNTGLNPSSLPTSLHDLADPKWKGKVGWAPGNASFQAHVSYLRHRWGEDATRTWLSAVRDNAARTYPKNSPQVLAANSGEISLGWVNHYYLHKLKKDGFKAANYSFPEAGRDGNVLMVSGVGVVAQSERKPLALALARFLVSAEAQHQLTTTGFEYPVRPGVAAHEALPALADIPLAEVDQQHLTDIGPTLDLLRELELQ